MKSKLTKILLLTLAAITLFGSLNVSAYEPYETYTYSIDGIPLESPHAYTPAVETYGSEDMGLDVSLKGVTDIVADATGNLYLADSGNNRIVILNKNDFKTIGVISEYTDEYGRLQSFSSPEGIYVTGNNMASDDAKDVLYVCDTNNKRIVVFDLKTDTPTYLRTIEKPDPDQVFLKNEEYTPTAIAVDKYERIFVVSRDCYQGIIVLSSLGDFTGFIGSQKVTYDLFEQIWKKFQTTEQKQAAKNNLPAPFNNIAVDEDGFVYATVNFGINRPEERANQLAAITSKAYAYSPVKKLNSMGKEIMKRNGFFDPGGEVNITKAEEVSEIIDIAMGDQGTWTILDEKRMRTYTYDQNGNLLFAFGSTGSQIGNGNDFVAMTYQVVYDEHKDDDVYNLVMVDNTELGYRLSVYYPTDYCDTIMAALENENNYNYSEMIAYWDDVLTANSNFDLAYIGKGKAYYSQGKYEEAMEMLATAYETEYYSDAFEEIRKEIIGKWMLPLVALIIVLIVLVAKFFGWAKKKNKAVSLKVGRKTYGEELLYVFHLIFHPFDGFWDLKHEKRGSVRAASTILGVTILAFFYQAIGRGYIFNPRDNYSTVFIQIISVIVPVLLWVVANWCLTTLFDGEGSFKDIYIATCYSLAPLPLFVIVSTILTNVATAGEASMVNLLVTIGYIWVGILLFFGMVVTHDYSTGKNVITTLGTIVAMAVIMFIIILFSSLVIKMITFIVAIFTEIANRM